MPSKLPHPVRAALRKVPRIDRGGSPDERRLDEYDGEARRGGTHLPTVEGPGLNTEPGVGDDGWHTPPPCHLRDGTRLQLYKDGEAAAAAFRAIEHAQDRVLLEVYIWPGDATGERFSELLARKASEGVQVFVLYDAFGCLLTPPEIFNRIERAGGNIVEFHPLNPWRSRWGWRPANRDHRKLLVVDQHIAGIGGLNIGDDYAGTWVAEDARVAPEDLWRDAGMGIVGPGAGACAEAFRRAWQYAVKRGPMRRATFAHALHLPAPAKGKRIGKSREGGDARAFRSVEDVLRDGHDLGFVGSAPSLSSPLRPFLHGLIRSAQKSLSLTMAYFAPDDQLIDALCSASRRGVKVRLMLAGRTDLRLLVIAGRAFYSRLLDAGCEVYEREHAMLHQKSIVADGKVAVLGSTNLDYRSIEFNLELSAVVRDEQFAGQLDDLFDHDVRYAESFDRERWRRRPWRDRFVQWSVSRLRYAL